MFAKQPAAPASSGEAGERQAQLRAIASGLLSWKGGLKVLRQAPLPKWRGCFQWQIEAKIEALQTAYARLRAEAAKEDSSVGSALGEDSCLVTLALYRSGNWLSLDEDETRLWLSYHAYHPEACRLQQHVELHLTA